MSILEKKYDDLTDAEFADWSAKLQGWRIKKTPWGWLWDTENKSFGKIIWNPRHSLEQCFAIEEWLADIYRRDWCGSVSQKYADLLDKITKFKSWHATADERCRALWITFGGRV